MPDTILVSSIDCVASIGVSVEERTVRHRLSIDVEVSTDTRDAARSDSLEDAIDYSEIVRVVVEVAGKGEYRLIETLAEGIAGRILSGFRGEAVRVRVRKVPPPLSAPVGFVGVEILRRAAGAT
jgi:dihydroneopterin aldolase